MPSYTYLLSAPATAAPQYTPIALPCSRSGPDLPGAVLCHGDPAAQTTPDTLHTLSLVPGRHGTHPYTLRARALHPTLLARPLPPWPVSVPPYLTPYADNSSPVVAGLGGGGGRFWLATSESGHTGMSWSVSHPCSAAAYKWTAS